MVSGNEGADLAQAGTESALPTHNEPAIVLTPIQGSEHVQQFLQTVPDSVLLSKQKSIQPSRLTRNANRSLFPNDKDSTETVTFITSQTLRNTAANKKLQCRKKGGKLSGHALEKIAMDYFEEEEEEPEMMAQEVF
ncbi:unnamed protein product [Miscanthus lutarioriparius]|uniref:Uncharacterized protein n=1 Tax=Miscanthus lutarioriparius TaxID=422564 RepID=A0A811Q8C1_9POAL|nr:unnamed protein product [Miscanthus lutarioriparius]